MLPLLHLVLNFSVIILPCFAYELLSIRRQYTPERVRLVFTILLAVSTDVLMYIGFPLGHGYLLDFRYLPVLIAYWYLGRESGLAVSCSVILFRLLYDPNFGVAITLFDLIAIFTGVYLFTRKGLLGAPIARLLAGFGTMSVISLLTLPSLFLIFHLDAFTIRTLILAYWPINLFGFFLVWYIMEMSLRTMKDRDQILADEKLRVVSELAASIAHEIRNPLTVVKGFVDLMGERTGVRDMEFIPLIQQELERAELVIQSYLNYAKPDQQNVETVNLSELVSRVVEMLRPYSSRFCVQLRSTIEPNLRTQAHHSQVIQVMVNIIKNAIEAVEQNGWVECSLRSTKQGHVVEVRDNGRGMGKDQIRRLGTPYYSTKSKGTGLGLMVVYQVMRSYGGSIEVSSEENVGTTFLLTFPAFAEETLEYRRVAVPSQN